MFKNKIKLFCLITCLFTIFIQTPAIANTTPIYQDRATNIGNAGTTKLEIQDNGRQVWWYAKTHDGSRFHFTGIITVKFKGTSRPFSYAVSGGGYGSVSKTLSFSKKIQQATLTGVGYIEGKGISITFPFSEVYNY
ncbi:hypothetical protein [Streptococcus acidominimus]|uniref:Uncharacterized protein n=1 Tax=Streptococcus acidominimus TaxID=1326 RepID=A0A1Q8E712_STRAI|nr:hypothetical protein [Streptococcus acidominimus]OLF47587.1 hypothetical protein BU200_10110 [Streptococcus acidominimus]SUN41417.1 Uncharacterised protein [Streptococcus acidominimus]